jgi:hypothetical protein
MSTGIEMIDDSAAGNANENMVNSIDNATVMVKKIVRECVYGWGVSKS